MKFLVTEEAPPLIEKHEVEASVQVTVKYIPEEAVKKSGSIRLEGITVEEFVEKVPDNVCIYRNVALNRS